MRNIITQLWLFWHGQHSSIGTDTFRHYYRCKVCDTKRWIKKNEPFRPRNKDG